jgi:hypothetical protein
VCKEFFKKQLVWFVFYVGAVCDSWKQGMAGNSVISKEKLQ